MYKPIGGVVLLAFIGTTSANAAAWCAYYDPSTFNCGFHTFEQCRANISGVGGYCSPNTYESARGERRPAGKRPRDY